MISYLFKTIILLIIYPVCLSAYLSIPSIIWISIIVKASKLISHLEFLDVFLSQVIKIGVL